MTRGHERARGEQTLERGMAHSYERSRMVPRRADPVGGDQPEQPELDQHAWRQRRRRLHVQHLPEQLRARQRRIHVRLELEAAGIVELDARDACRQQQQHAARSQWTLAAIGLTRRTSRDSGKGDHDKRRQHPDIFVVPKQHEFDGDTGQSEQQQREQQLTQNIRRVIAHADKRHASQRCINGALQPVRCRIGQCDSCWSKTSR